jgi:hypothetical protein
MKKVITFSLWGDNPTYNIGAIRNAEDAIKWYPDFECWFYIHENSVPRETIEKLKVIKNTKIFMKSGNVENEDCKPRMWRFEAIDNDDVEIMMSRDTDTRFLEREKLAVDEWLADNTLFHIMRDHPHHGFCILAGMFGTKKIPQLLNWIKVMDLYSKTDNRMYDQDFLRDHIYPLIKNDSTIHASFYTIEPNVKRFPIDYCSDFKFVGEYVYADETRSISHINALKESISY